MAIDVSSLLGLVFWAMLLKSPKAVLFAAALSPPAVNIEERAGLDLFL